MRDYLVREISRRAGDSGPSRWLFVMSGPLNFSHQEETRIPELPPDSNRHIIYLRFSGGFGNGVPGSVPLALGPDVQIRPAAAHSRAHARLRNYRSHASRQRPRHDGSPVSRRSGTSAETDGRADCQRHQSRSFPQDCRIADSGNLGQLRFHARPLICLLWLACVLSAAAQRGPGNQQIRALPIR